MEGMYFCGSSLTVRYEEAQRIESESELLSAKVLGLMVYEYERWMYGLLELDKNNYKKIRHTKDRILFPYKGCTLYISKPKNFSSMLRAMIDKFLPYRPGLLDAVQVMLWDEDDSFKEMTINCIEKDGEDFIVDYTSPAGEQMTVKGNELGDDEVANIIEALAKSSKLYVV